MLARLQIFHLRRIRLDLTDLLSADAVGIDALRRLGHGGAEFVGVAQYLRRLLA